MTRLLPFLVLGRTYTAAPGEIGFKFWLQGSWTAEPARQAKLARAVHLAADALSAVWPRAIVRGTLQGSWIFVRPTPSWTDSFGRVVGGLSYDRGVEVGVNLWSLCHEFAHFIQFRFERVGEPDHTTWDARGITAAIAVYREALAKAFG